MFITSELLVTKGACPEQREIFRMLFPGGIEVTRDLCAAHARIFDWDWASLHLLTPVQRDVYDAVVKPARDAYDAAVGPASDPYYAVVQPASDAYYAAVKPARDAYHVVQALAFWGAAVNG